ncbi:hypothetical protein T484DRAFT_1949996 [Baffinella frigidus]|nr:hypothetical protein T484DRAFT_1949996 [Cryptophyta sp. CCMP2293]
MFQPASSLITDAFSESWKVAHAVWIAFMSASSCPAPSTSLEVRASATWANAVRMAGLRMFEMASPSSWLEATKIAAQRPSATTEDTAKASCFRESRAFLYC